MSEIKLSDFHIMDYTHAAIYKGIVINTLGGVDETDEKQMQFIKRKMLELAKIEGNYHEVEIVRFDQPKYVLESNDKFKKDLFQRALNSFIHNE